MLALRCLVAMTLLMPFAARAACMDRINKALPIARDLPDWKGRNAVLQNIERARDAWHEGDEEGCQEQIAEVLALLCPPTPAGKADAAPARTRDSRCGS